MSDDGVGSRVIEELDRITLPPHVQTLEGGTPGLGLVSLIEGWERLIVIDAADMGSEPGAIARFHPDDVQLISTSQNWSLHDLGLKQALELARKLGAAPNEIIILGVQPARVDWGQRLSSDVEKAIPALVAAVLKEIGVQHAQNLDY